MSTADLIGIISAGFTTISVLMSLLFRSAIRAHQQRADEWKTRSDEWREIALERQRQVDHVVEGMHKAAKTVKEATR